MPSSSCLNSIFSIGTNILYSLRDFVLFNNTNFANQNQEKIACKAYTFLGEDSVILGVEFFIVRIRVEVELKI